MHTSGIFSVRALSELLTTGSRTRRELYQAEEARLGATDDEIENNKEHDLSVAMNDGPELVVSPQASRREAENTS